MSLSNSLIVFSVCWAHRFSFLLIWLSVWWAHNFSLFSFDSTFGELELKVSHLFSIFLWLLILSQFISWGCSLLWYCVVLQRVRCSHFSHFLILSYFFSLHVFCSHLWWKNASRCITQASSAVVQTFMCYLFGKSGKHKNAQRTRCSQEGTYGRECSRSQWWLMRWWAWSLSGQIKHAWLQMKTASKNVMLYLTIACWGWNTIQYAILRVASEIWVIFKRFF